MTEGIDISYWQGAVDMAKVATEKRFVIVRGGDGTFVDPRRAEYADAARAAGMAVECYHFMRMVSTPAEAEAQCRASLAATGAQFLWLDMEDDRAPKAPSANVAWLRALSWRLQDVRHGIYTGAWWWGPWMKNSGEFAHLPLWVANYTQTHINRKPTLFGGWADYHTWQYSSSGTVAGIKGDVDLNWREQEDDMAGVKLVRKDGEPAVYFAAGGILIHIPSEEALTAQGWTQADVTVLPADNAVWKLPRFG